MSQNTLENAAKLFYKTILTEIIDPVWTDNFEERLTHTQISCLHYVFLHNEPSIGGIAEGLSISNAAAAKLTDRLVKKDLLVREEDSADRRVLKIKLTPKSLTILDEFNKFQARRFAEIIGKMPQIAVQSLEYGLAEFLKAALVDPGQIEEICLKCGWKHFPECPGNQRYRELTSQDMEKF